MKANNKITKWLTLLLCALMAAGVLTLAAGAAEPTGRCSNLLNEGIEYFTPWGALGSEANKWRGELKVSVVTQVDKTYAGDVIAMELEAVNNSSRYQCTQVTHGATSTTFSCNSLPVNAIIGGVYFRYIPGGDLQYNENTQISFIVEEALPENPAVLMNAGAVIKYPPYPCSRNELLRDFVTPVNDTMVFYTDGDCDGISIDQQKVKFYEQSDQFAIVNIIDAANIDPTRFNMTIEPAATFDFSLDLYFMDFEQYQNYLINPEMDIENSKHIITYNYTYDPTTKSGMEQISVKKGFSGLTNTDLPLRLMGGQISNLKAKESDGWGNLVFPSDIDMSIYFWYENMQGTRGYENSIFHFERALDIEFAPTCTNTGVSSQLYDPCQATAQMATVTLPDPIPVTNISVVNTTNDADSRIKRTTYWFLTRKCVNADCTWVTSTDAYPYSITMSDGGGSARSYGLTGYLQHDPSTRAPIAMRAYGTAEHPFQIVGARLVVQEPGTYVVYCFVPSSQMKKTVPEGSNIPKFYVTVSAKNELDTCSTPANNGYFRATWNDCLSSGETQLMTFEHIQGKEEAWMENHSNHDVYFPYVSEWSYVPQKLQVASLTYYATALSNEGRPGEAWCNPEGCYVPRHTKVTITGGTMYLEGYPKYDEYRVAYARKETYNISHLFFNVHVKECERKIPNTGISLRSPLKVNEKVNPSVDPATSYVFTGNSLRIPAIGIGMETPIPIVHVYYEEGSDGMKWDLSTLGNYVGELEGGSYIPYGGNSVLTGHFYSQGVFKNLENLNMEDEIYVYGNDGVKYIYKVVQKFIAQPEDVYEMFQQVGDRSLTLVTCENYNMVTDEYERRYIVRAVLESQDIYEEGIW